MMDVVYFDDDRALENNFKTSVLKAFPNAVLEDAYDEFKGYRQTVTLEGQVDDYFAWIIAEGWLYLSLTMQLLMRDQDDTEFRRIWALAKEKYPQAFKPQTV